MPPELLEDVLPAIFASGPRPVSPQPGLGFSFAPTDEELADGKATRRVQPGGFLFLLPLFDQPAPLGSGVEPLTAQVPHALCFLTRVGE